MDDTTLSEVCDVSNHISGTCLQNVPESVKYYGTSKEDLKSFYCATIRSVVEYGAQLWHGNLTNAPLEELKKRALRIIYPGLE